MIVGGVAWLFGLQILKGLILLKKKNPEITLQSSLNAWERSTDSVLLGFDLCRPLVLSAHLAGSPVP